MSSKTSWGRHYSRSSENVFKTSLRVLQDVFARRVPDLFKTCSRRVQDVFEKTSCSYVFKMSWRRLQCNNFMSSKTSWGRHYSRSSENVFKTSLRVLQDVFARRVPDLFKTCSRRVQDVFEKTSCSYVFKMSWRRLEDLLEDEKKCYTEDVFKTSSRHFQYVFTKANFAGRVIVITVLCLIYEKESLIDVLQKSYS